MSIENTSQYIRFTTVVVVWLVLLPSTAEELKYTIDVKFQLSYEDSPKSVFFSEKQ